MHTTVANKLWS